jgi:Arc/MetJ-type ribon-helix-helix transcriptional regulator
MAKVSSKPLINKPVSIGLPPEYIAALKKELPKLGYVSLSEFVRTLIEANSTQCALIKERAERGLTKKVKAK